MLSRYRLQFRLRIDATGGRVVTGRPSADFVRKVREIARLHNIVRGDIECRGTGRHARLRFTRGFPDQGRQAIRNVWTPPVSANNKSGPRATG